MESTRQQKVARQIQKDLGEILQTLDRETTMGTMLTVTVVRMSPDLSLAKVYVSVFPSDKGTEVIQHLQQHVRMIRHQLGLRVRHQLRVVPEVVFYVDDSLDYVEHIDALLSR